MNIQDINIESIDTLTCPKEVFNILPSNEQNNKFIQDSRNTIQNILDNKDKRIIVIIGPCSIHNIQEAKEYANMLYSLSEKVKDKLFIIMRVYFEKPRTTIGWKGLINDPEINNSFNINKGIQLARELLLYTADLGLPAGSEILDTFIPQYIGDLLSWGAIGARTTESQIHRQLVSGLSFPMGFKNNTHGDVKVAMDAIESARNSHCFFGITDTGRASIVKTTGNNYCHIILRGSKDTPNYYKENIDKIKLNNQNIFIDCSHGNSKKDYKNQKIVWKYILDNYISQKEYSIIKGLMLESNIYEGAQKTEKPLKKGVSITDSCIGFTETEKLIMDLYHLHSMD